MDFDLYTRRISRHLEIEHTRRFGSRRNKICNSREIFSGVKKEVWRGNDELAKVVKLKRVEQGSGTMEEFVQKFRRIARSNMYKGRVLVEEVKQEMSRVIKRKSMEAERPP